MEEIKTYTLRQYVVNIVAQTEDGVIKTDFENNEEEADYLLNNNKEDMVKGFKKWAKETFCSPHMPVKRTFISCTEDLLTYSINK